jgi:hypothetical protein
MTTNKSNFTYMKTTITKTIALAFLILTSSILFSCSKKEDNPTPVPVAETYIVPVTINFGGALSTSTLTLTKLPANINLCNNYQVGAEKLSGKLGFIIYNFNATGGALDKADGAQDCVKMQFSGEIDVAGITYQYYNKVSNGGNITVAGKTYSMTCNAYQKNDSNPNAIYVITATWTKP